MSDKNESKKVKEWYEKFIDYFREEYDKLSPEDKLGINNTNDYRKPCQIEIFWIEPPSQQLIVITNFDNRLDKEVIVNGPFIANKFFDNVKSILHESRWQKKLESSDPNFLEYHNTETYAGELAGVIHYFIENFKNTVIGLFHAQENGYAGGQSLFSKAWIQNYNGNIANRDYKNEVNNIITGIKNEAKRKREEIPIPVKVSAFDNSEGGYGIHLFPPVIIGDVPKFSVDQILLGNTYDLSSREKVYDGKILNHIIVLNKNGFIFIDTKQQIQALRLFNLIMAVGVLHDLSLHAVREHDLSKCGFDRETQQVTSMQYSLQSMRSLLFTDHMQPRFGIPYRKTKLSLDKVKEIISDVEKIAKVEKLVEELRLFIESYTHFQNSEHAQSFIMSWSIIERYYSDIWRKKLDEKDLDHDRANKLSNPNQWSIDYIIEVLNLNSDISDNEYDLLMELKTKRNRFYHRGKQVSKDDAEKGLAITRSILKKKIEDTN